MELRNVSQVGHLIADVNGRLIFVPPGETLSLPEEAAFKLLTRSPADWAPATRGEEEADEGTQR